MNIKIIIGYVLLLVCLGMTTGCKSTHNPIPQGYSGGTAQIDDTYIKKSTGSAEFFYVGEVDGKYIENAVAATNRASYGQGMRMLAQGATRKVPTQSMKLKLVGQVHHSAPVGYLFNSGENHIVKGEIVFTPIANMLYFVKGTLSTNYSAVWLEDMEGNQVSDAVVLDASKNTNEETVVVALSAGVVNSPKIAKALPEQVDQKTESLPESKNTLYKNPLLKVNEGMSEEALQKYLGTPDRILNHDANFFTSRPEKRELYYKSIGTVVLESRANSNMFVSKVHMVPNNERDGLTEILSTADSVKARHLGQRYFNIGLYDPEALDIMAQKIWQHKHTADGHLLDGISWYCKVIGKSENGRYAKLLNNVVSDKTVPSKLRRHCKSPAKSLQKLAIGNTQQFEPVTL